MNKVLIEVESGNKKSILAAIALLTLMSGGKAEATAPAKGKGKSKPAEEGEEFEEVESQFEDFGSEENEEFGEDDPMSFEEDEFPEEEEEIEEKPKKGKAAPAKGKAAPASKGGKKITLTDLQKAFRTFAAENGNAEALKILKKFKAKNVQGLDEEVYPQVMKLLK